MMNGVSIFGGFDPSRGDVNIGDRDWMENETILSGDIGIPGNNADNSYHIFCNSAELNLNGNAILNGFKIISGNSTGSTGGGMVNENASPELTNIIFSGNNEAALANWSSSPRLTNVSFLGNTGDAIINWYSNPRLYNVVFNNNTGRGMFNGESYPTLVNATFYGNSGGGIYNHDSSSTTLTNSIMWRDGTFEIFNDWGSSNVTYSDIQVGFDGEGNIKLYPRFVSPSSGGFHLMHSSPCIDAGNNLTPGLPGGGLRLPPLRNES
jgi:hypothetical protein